MQVEPATEKLHFSNIPHTANLNLYSESSVISDLWKNFQRVPGSFRPLTEYRTVQIQNSKIWSCTLIVKLNLRMLSVSSWSSFLFSFLQIFIL